ncbi:MAG TPA: siderophore-interacting protein [Pseudonocardiaceae bacterium]|nr:siderophore-interacting protein [Pseudonocardiaceae bacterium]
MLLTADETALPAVESILAWLPAGLSARVWIEVASAQDIRGLPTRADARITWLVREGRPSGALTLGAIARAELPAGTPYAWIAGEAGEVRELRRHLVGERGVDRGAVTFTGYWRRGAGEDDLIAEHFTATDN